MGNWGFFLCGLLVGAWLLHVMWWGALVILVVGVVWVVHRVIAPLVVPMVRLV